MDRRRFVLTALAGAFAAPLAALAQTPAKVPTIGILTPGGCPNHPTANLVLEGLKTRGYVPGQNVHVECRFPGTLDAEQFRGFASELVRLKVDVIFAVSSTATQAVRSVTKAIPVVALDLETDPEGSRVAVSLGRPGANTTGIFPTRMN